MPNGFFLAAALAAAATPSLAQYWFCNTNPNDLQKTAYVSEVFGPYAPDPDPRTAVADVTADFAAFIDRQYPGTMAKYHGASRAISCSPADSAALLAGWVTKTKAQMAGRGPVVETRWTDAEGLAGHGAHLARIVQAPGK